VDSALLVKATLVSCGRRDGTQYRCERCHRCDHEFDADYPGGVSERTAYRCEPDDDSEGENLICWTCLLKSDLCAEHLAGGHPVAVSLTFLLSLDSDQPCLVEVTR
jgi:hypothetical protein